MRMKYKRGLLVILCVTVAASTVAGYAWFKSVHRAQNDLYGFQERLQLESASIQLLPGEERYITKTAVVEKNGFITNIDPFIGTGGNILHHSILFVEGERDSYYFCSGDQARKVLFTSGAELLGLQFPAAYGVPVRKGQRLTLEAHLANPDRKKISRGSVGVALTVTANAKPADTLHLVAGVPMEGPCRAGRDRLISYPIPKGVATYTAKLERPFMLAEPRTLIAWGGHMHAYGSSITLFSGEERVSELRPDEVADKKTRAGMTIAWHDFVSPVYLDRNASLQIKAVYEKPLELEIPEAMAIVYLIFAVEK
jgi:hypothetical protein